LCVKEKWTTIYEVCGVNGGRQGLENDNPQEEGAEKGIFQKCGG